MLKAFPKIFAIGTDYISTIFDSPAVEITEKIDGSQFVFGKIDNELFARSKGAQLFFDNPTKMFTVGTDYIQSIEDKIPNNTVFYCEYLNSPHHNTLEYSRVPKNNLILFGISEETGTRFIDNYEELKKYADKLNIETVPLIFKGKIDNQEVFLEMLEKESILGKSKIEGVVAKNYYQPFLLGGQPIPVMAGKYVSEEFKEVHRKNWKNKKTTGGKWQTFKDSYKTEARWDKSIQHLAEKDDLDNSPKDIGKLIKEIQRDITEEEIDNIKKFLWNEFGKELLRYSTKGFPEFYKKKLLKRSFK